MSDCDPTHHGLIAHLEQQELSSRKKLQHTKRAIRDLWERLMPLEYYEHWLPLHRATHRKWKGWLDWARAQATRTPRRKK